MSDREESDDYKPDLENAFPRGAYEAMQNDNPSANDIADALEKFGQIEIVREWAIEVLRTKRPNHRPKNSHRIFERQLENGLHALENDRGLYECDERTLRRHKVIAGKYLELMDQFVEADKKS